MLPSGITLATSVDVAKIWFRTARASTDVSDRKAVDRRNAVLRDCGKASGHEIGQLDFTRL